MFSDSHKKILIIGTSCSGKTTFARKLSELLSVPHLELDEYHWAPNWVEVPDQEFFNRVNAFTSNNRNWIIDGNYSQLRERLWPQANVIIWLNYSFPVTFYRAIKRTFLRVFTGKKLFHGNRETLSRAFFSRDSILLWVIQTHHQRKISYSQLLTESFVKDAQKVILTNPSQADSYLRGISESNNKRFLY